MKGPIVFIYVILEYTGILLFLFLLAHCIYRSINYTLQIFCIVAILNNINESVLIFIRDLTPNHHYPDLAYLDGTFGCGFSAFIEHLLPLVMSCLSTCMAFNIWYLVVTGARHTERELVKWYGLFSVLLPLVLTSIAAILLRNKPNFTADPSRFYCTLRNTAVTRGTFDGPLLAINIPGIFFSLYIVVVLVGHYISLRKTLSQSPVSTFNVVVDLSYCIRLLIFCIAVGVVIVMATIRSLSDPRTYETSSYYPSHLENDNAIEAMEAIESRGSITVFAEFSGSIVGHFTFLVFGTTRSAWESMCDFARCRCCDNRRRLKGSRPESGSGLGSGLGSGSQNVDEHWARSGRRIINAQDKEQGMNNIIYYDNYHENLSHDGDAYDAINNHNYTAMYLGNNSDIQQQDGGDYSNYKIHDNCATFTESNRIIDSQCDRNDNNSTSSSNNDPATNITQVTDTFNPIASSHVCSVNTINTNSSSSGKSSRDIHNDSYQPEANDKSYTDHNNYINHHNNNDNNTIDFKMTRQKKVFNKKHQPKISVVPSAPLLSSSPLPENPTFQEMMLYDFYHAIDKNGKNDSDGQILQEQQKRKKQQNKKLRQKSVVDGLNDHGPVTDTCSIAAPSSLLQQQQQQQQQQQPGQLSPGTGPSSE